MKLTVASEIESEHGSEVEYIDIRAHISKYTKKLEETPEVPTLTESQAVIIKAYMSVPEQMRPDIAVFAGMFSASPEDVKALQTYLKALTQQKERESILLHLSEIREELQEIIRSLPAKKGRKTSGKSSGRKVTLSDYIAYCPLCDHIIGEEGKETQKHLRVNEMRLHFLKEHPDEVFNEYRDEVKDTISWLIPEHTEIR